jgi:hypothetical protein
MARLADELKEKLDVERRERKIDGHVNIEKKEEELEHE